MKTKEEVAALKEVNGQQKEEIVRLREELRTKVETKSEKEATQSSDGYKHIKDAIEIITRGLIKKENNIDMKTVIAEILKIKRIVNEHVFE